MRDKRKTAMLSLVLNILGVILIMIWAYPSISNKRLSSRLDKTAGISEGINLVTKDTTEDKKSKTGVSSDGRKKTKKAEEIPMPDKDIDLKALRKKNPDICAFIYIPDTPVCYPVLLSQDDYYLYHDADKNRTFHGSIFTRDDKKSGMVLFGHNMRDGTMFASIKRYADTGYAKKHRFAYLYTDKGWSVYRYLRHDLISAVSDVPQTNDDMLALITCNGKKYRMAVFFRKID